MCLVYEPVVGSNRSSLRKWHMLPTAALQVVHSFIPAISIAPLQVLYYSEALPTTGLQHGYCIGVSRRSAQAAVGKGLTQGPYVAERAGVEPTTLRLKVINQGATTSHPRSLWVP